MRHRYAAAVLGGCALLILGIVIGITVRPTAPPATPIAKARSPLAAQAPIAADPLAEARAVLDDTVALRLFRKAAGDRDSELSLWTYPSVSRIRAGGETIFDSHVDAPLFAKASEGLVRLEAAGMLAPSRRVRTREGYERQVYALTTLGHDVAKMIKQ